MDDFYSEAKKVPEGYRLCSTCRIVKSTDEFYKDGFSADNAPRFRRDCKECYKKTRASAKKPKYLIPVRPSKRRK